MKYLCQVCGQNFPFASDLASHASIYSAEKKFKCTYPKCIRMYKTKAEYNRHYNYRHKQKSAESQEIKCKMCDKIFSKVKYLKEHMKSHMDNLPFGCHLCGKCFKWRSGHKLHIDEERRKVLVMNSKHFCIYIFSWYKLFNTKLLVFASVYVCPGIFSFTLC